MTEIVEEEEATEKFTLTEPMRRVGLADLPASPKSTHKAATALGWSVQAWLTVGEIAPVLFIANTEKNAAGSVRFEGYTARYFTVEARDPLMPLGFRATFLGKEYAAATGRKPVGGSFDSALVVDPIGIIQPLSATYKAIPQTRDKYETEASINRRRSDAQKMADNQTAQYNDGAVVFSRHNLLTTTGAFNSWLAEWQSFIITGKKTNA